MARSRWRRRAGRQRCGRGAWPTGHSASGLPHRRCCVRASSPKRAAPPARRGRSCREEVDAPPCPGALAARPGAETPPRGTRARALGQLRHDARAELRARCEHAWKRVSGYRGGGTRAQSLAMHSTGILRGLEQHLLLVGAFVYARDDSKSADSDSTRTANYDGELVTKRCAGISGTRRLRSSIEGTRGLADIRSGTHNRSK